MAARSMWNGTLVVGKVEIAVKLYAALEDRGIHFHLLHASDHERVKQRMVNPVTGKTCSRGQIHKGYEIEKGKYVLLSAEELAELQPAASRQIEIASFVPESAIAPVWYQRPYYLMPAAKGAAKCQEYFALAQALSQGRRVGLGHWVMRKRTYHGALRAHGDYLTLSSLHSAEEVAQAPKVAPASRQADARELSMAEQLVAALAGEFDPSEFRDEHRQRVMELIEAKAKGKLVELPGRYRKPRERPLGEALEQSLKQAQKHAHQRGRERLSA